MNINLTLIGQSITFFLFVWFTMKFVWPPILKALEERKAKIADGLAAAERGVHEQALAQQRATEVLKEAKQQAAKIIGQAEARGNELLEEAKHKAQAEAARIVESAQGEIEQAANGAREALRTQVAELAVAGASQILAREVKADDHRDMLNKLAAQL